MYRKLMLCLLVMLLQTALQAQEPEEIPIITAENVTQLQVLETVQGHRGLVADIAFSPDQRLMVSGGYDGVVLLWDFATRQVIATLEGHTAPIDAVAFSYDGFYIASGDWNHEVRLWDISNIDHPVEVAVFTDAGGRIFDLSFSYDHRVLAAASSDGSLYLWNIRTHTLASSVISEEEALYSVYITESGGGEYVVLTGGTGGVVKWWYALNQKRVISGQPVPARWITDLEWHSDQLWIAAVGAQESVYHLWQRQDIFQPVATQPTDDWIEIEVAMPLVFMLTYDVERQITVWNTGILLATLTIEDYPGAGSIALTPDNRILVVGTANGAIQFWGIVPVSEEE
ncbi:MAG: hypothetical protein KJ064_27550 [Anaerolineae bacterium]|nr:hypothetical protein [Anaerolineae bacterium]